MELKNRNVFTTDIVNPIKLLKIKAYSNQKL
jgi:hypothetical protein